MTTRSRADHDSRGDREGQAQQLLRALHPAAHPRRYSTWWRSCCRAWRRRPAAAALDSTTSRCASCSSSISGCACGAPRRAAVPRIHQRGWLDPALGSILTSGLFRVTSLLRLARLSRLFRVLRQFRSEWQHRLAKDVLANRPVRRLRHPGPGRGRRRHRDQRAHGADREPGGRSSITTGGDAIWWAIVTITTRATATSIR